MTPEQWREIKDVLGHALELDPDKRVGYLDEACAGNQNLRFEVDSLLKSCEEDSSFLSVPAAEAFVPSPNPDTASRRIGTRFGSYELLGVIAEGGMGTVYRAKRADGLYEKQVAIKIIKAELPGQFFLSHFESERRILARLEHPNIARLFDGGVTSDGLPFLVLEYIDGTPIDQYCRDRQLSVPDRLELFRTVCGAVQYAHQNLVVHRDLKPANILVTADGIPKLLDFGVAKALNPQPEEAQGATTVAMLRILTPDFASPEQVRGEPITIASDVYSLGVILYLLLTGERPYRVTGTSPQQIIDGVCKVSPKRPSAVVGGTGAKTLSIEDSPRLFRARLARALRGDLDCILLKAIRKEPDLRYPTVAEFSNDIDRYLARVPVKARKGTNVYRLSRFLARNRGSVTVAAILLVVLLTSTGMILREGYLAQRRFNDVRRLANSLIFEIHDSIKDLPGSTPARKLIVERATEYLDNLSKESRGDDSLQRELASAFERVGEVQGQEGENSLGDASGSLATFRKEFSIRQRLAAKTRNPEDRLALARSFRLIADQEWELGDVSQARVDIRSAITTSEELNRSNPNQWETLNELASDYSSAGESENGTYAWGAGGAAKREGYRRKAVEIDRAMLVIRPDDLNTLFRYSRHLRSLAFEVRAADLRQAQKLRELELSIAQRVYDQSGQSLHARAVALAHEDIADTYDRLGDHVRSFENYFRSLEVARKLVADDPKNALMRRTLAVAYLNVATQLRKLGRWSESIKDSEEANHIMRSVMMADPKNQFNRGFMAEASIESAVNFLEAGRPDLALKEFEEGCSIFDSLAVLRPADNAPKAYLALCSARRADAEELAGSDAAAAMLYHRALEQVQPFLNASDATAFWAAAAQASFGLGNLSRKSARQPDQPLPMRHLHWQEAASWYAKSVEAWEKAADVQDSTGHYFDLDAPDRKSKAVQARDAALRLARAHSGIGNGEPRCDRCIVTGSSSAASQQTRSRAR